MQTFSRRPLAAAICISLPFAFISARVDFIFRLLLTVAVIAGTVVLLLILQSRPKIAFCSLELRTFVALAAFMTLSLLLSSHTFNDAYLTGFERIDKASSTRAVVTGVRFEASYGSTLDVELISIDGEKQRGSGILLAESSSGAAIGDVIECEGEFIPLEGAWEDYESDRHYMLASGIHFAIRCKQLRITGATRTMTTLLSGLREKLCSELSLRLDRESAALSCALLLGERSELGIIRRDFTRSGVMHLLALSGMHLTLMCRLIDRLTKLLRIGKRSRILLSAAFTVFYAALTGFSPSLMRAAVMLVMMNLILLSGHDRDPITSLFAAFWLIVLLEPAAISDVGLLMSFAATLGILLVSDSARTLAKRIGSRLLAYIVESVTVSLGALLFLIPIQYFAFGEISLWTIPATVILSPAIGIMLTLLIPYLGCSLLGIGELASLLSVPIAALSDFMIGTASAMSAHRAAVSLEYPFTLPIMLACAAVLVVMSASGVRNRLAMFIPFAISCAIFFSLAGIYTYFDGVRLYTLSHNSSDALILTDRGSCTLIDISSGSSALMRKSTDRLRHIRATEIDTLVLTHLHRKHTAMLRDLNEDVLVRRILLPEPVDDDERLYLADILELADSCGIEVEQYPRRTAAQAVLGDITLTLELPKYIDRSVHPIISLIIDMPDFTAAYLGSAYTEYLPIPEADVRLFGSHGPIKKQEPSLEGVSSFLILSDAMTLTEIKSAS